MTSMPSALRRLACSPAPPKVNAKGELSGAFAFGGADEQAKRLRADGIDVIDGRVDLDKYGIRIADDIIHTKTTVEPFT